MMNLFYAIEDLKKKQILPIGIQHQHMRLTAYRNSG